MRAHLRPHFGETAIGKVGSDEIKGYIQARKAAGAANATFNNELALPRRAFNLGAQSDPPKVLRVPRIPKLETNNVRKGFFEDADYQALMRTLPEYLRPALALAYFTGCRRGEVLTLQWDQVDLLDGIARLNPGETKNDEARIIPLAPDLLELLRLQMARRDATWPSCPWVIFHHETGERVKSIKGAWSRACFAAGLWTGDEATGKPTRLFHDLRRTGVRNLVRAGVPEKVAQTISGHKTRAVFERYNIVNETDLKDAARRLQEYVTGKRSHTESEASHTMVTQNEKTASRRPS